MRLLLAAGFILFNIAIYLFMAMLYKRYRLPVLLPALTATFTVVVLLLGFDISYDTYMIGGEWINRLLGPAVVSLAYPLYKQRHVLRENLPAVLGGTVTGLLVGMLSGLLLAAGLGFSKIYVLSILPKSITTAVAIQISGSLGGDSSLTSVFVMIAGFTGAIGGPYIIKLFRIRSESGIGIGLGTASHALGTAKALEYGEQSVSMSSVAMTVCAIVGSIVSPLVVWIMYH
ncbi:MULTISPECIES: LrgB family protein [unclassified Paenibacillus]|uniref:LrgB family protein n=1 Tax=unclassified Paenibacillus TaxID=185978 RepID=UPI0024074B61|nr:MULTISPECIES: LrgB family protein [unclassified Paenibacillus]MDF9842537.1 putative murein hydrolase (TIGR00659 family) [Paenibacillus sp. PastF-2]MDF9849256.1 putative murein hydrolase (TIGR00659 family) [Paenibacillus sp. PastM-2]MDF9855697.1 putative murein hydrolase (TIGR00659 family) [Paenibacillus sp. PastF-1]MDH6481097.1 putative murein hydrolase (TIGR00659 family) [Paenibacillus sp. PastH-2]MDH6508391.1 putative murein hydrolase (TIGR00659 family) [Paenibacillus sp. PastM-3]